MPFIAKLAGKATGIKVRAALTVFVDQAAIGKGWAVLGIQRGRAAKGNDMSDGCKEVMRIRRAAGNINDGFPR